MPATDTPIRYPGGKTKLYSFVREILVKNDLLSGTYCEPFAGGAGLAVKLLLKKDVQRIVINDADYAIFSLWNAILNESEYMCSFIENVDISIDEWEKQRFIYLNSDNYSPLEIAQATIFLNRTNVSGILTGGVIGGREQTGSFKMDARFNRQTLVKKIKTIAAVADQIELYNLDVLDFMDEIYPSLDEKTFLNFDPPYVNKGGLLYKNSFTEDDHRRLRDRISICDKKWIVTYDICDLTKNLYSAYRCQKVGVNYSANASRFAQEYVFFSDNLII